MAIKEHIFLFVMKLN